MKSIMRWFASPCSERGVSHRRSFRPSIDGLESRRVLSTVTAAPGATVSVQADLSTNVLDFQADRNTNVLNFAASHLHQKVGGGECAHLACEALRVAGAMFVPGDPNNNGDYTWGTLVTTITSGGDSSPAAACRPGDIIQFQNVTLADGTSAAHHTAIVADVDSQGRPTQVYEQNVNGDRTDRLDTLAVNANTLTSGTVHIYRPHSFSYWSPVFNRYMPIPDTEYSVVNNTPLPQTVTLYFGEQIQGTVSLSEFNTADSYRVGLFGLRSITGPWWYIGINGTRVVLEASGGYEVFAADDQVSIRTLRDEYSVVNQFVQGGPPRLAHAFQPIESADSGQNVRRVGALAASFLDQSEFPAPVQQGIQKELFESAYDQAMVEAGIRPFKAKAYFQSMRLRTASAA